jgi:hypothetical protein
MTEKQFLELDAHIKVNQVLLRAIVKKLGITQDELSIEAKALLNNIKAGVSVDTNTPSPKEGVVSEDTKEYPSVDDAPEWKLVFKVNTSEGVSTQKIIQKAWTEKQAIYLGRTEQLFPTMNELVKAKQIQAKWNVLESQAEKISA